MAWVAGFEFWSVGVIIFLYKFLFWKKNLWLKKQWLNKCPNSLKHIYSLILLGIVGGVLYVACY